MIRCSNCEEPFGALNPLDIYDAVADKGICNNCYDKFKNIFKKKPPEPKND